jgi:hypothetical protein
VRLFQARCPVFEPLGFIALIHLYLAKAPGATSQIRP